MIAPPLEKNGDSKREEGTVCANPECDYNTFKEYGLHPYDLGNREVLLCSVCIDHLETDWFNYTISRLR